MVMQSDAHWIREPPNLEVFMQVPICSVLQSDTHLIS
jgi:hypothetical protein